LEAKTILTFTSTIHDPENRLGYLIEEVGESLRGLFRSAMVSYSPGTHPDTIRLLDEQGYSTFKAEDTVVGSYRTALAESIPQITDRILYCDLDRALHWIKNYPEELRTLTESIPQNDFILMGRTMRAFNTHPETQTMTEGIANTLISKTLGFPEAKDILGTTWILTPTLAESMLKLNSINQYGFYAEWPIHMWKTSEHPLFIEVEGLEWETPDRYRAEIKAQGLEQWKKSFQTPTEWRRRNLMLRDFIESTINI
jgi:hypothetical protein